MRKDNLIELLNKKLEELEKENKQPREKLLEANKKLDHTRERENEKNWNTDMGR